MNSLQRVVVIGATSSIAEQVARILVAEGASVYCVGRNEEKLEVLLNDLRVRAGKEGLVGGCSADLVDRSKHEELIRDAERFLGDIDGVLVAHGSLPSQSDCEVDVALTQRELDLNALSVINLLTHFANRFEASKSGVISVISSVAGDRGRQSNYVYGAAKGMVSIFLQGLRNRLAKSNVDVVTVKPGFVDTPMTDGFDKSGPLWTKPDKVARGIVRAMRKGTNVAYLPWFWRCIMLIITHIPEFIFKRMSL